MFTVLPKHESYYTFKNVTQLQIGDLVFNNILEDKISYLILGQELDVLTCLSLVEFKIMQLSFVDLLYKVRGNQLLKTVLVFN